MEDLHFRKKLIWNEIERLKRSIRQNQEFINLFHNQNNQLMQAIEMSYQQIDEIGERILEAEHKALI